MEYVLCLLFRLCSPFLHTFSTEKCIKHFSKLWRGSTPSHFHKTDHKVFHIHRLLTHIHEPAIPKISIRFLLRLLCAATFQPIVTSIRLPDKFSLNFNCFYEIFRYFFFTFFVYLFVFYLF